MTREELIHHIRYSIDINADIILTNDEGKEVIKALEQDPCKDAISRQAVLNATVKNNSVWNSITNSKGENLEEIVLQLPSVNPQEPKTGHWILADEQNKEDVENDNYRFICSECQCSDIHAKGTKVPYCWNCGTKMESEDKDGKNDI